MNRAATFTACVFGLGLGAACGAIVGIEGFENVPASDSIAETGGAADAGSETSAPDAESVVTVGGEVHFLQATDSLELSLAVPGAAPLTLAISGNGPFVFAGAVAKGASYAVTVTKSPANRSCWVRRGSGTAAGAVTDVDVRCVAIATSASAASTQTTGSTTYVDFPTMPAISLRTDVPETHLLMTLFVPSLSLFYGNNFRGDARIAVELDGVVVTEAVRQMDAFGYTGMSQILDVVVAGAGDHTLKAKWKRGPLGDLVNAPLVSFNAIGGTFPAEMSVTALESLSTYERTLSAVSSSTSMTSSPTADAMGLADVEHTPATDQPALGILHAALAPSDGDQGTFAEVLLDGAVVMSGYGDSNLAAYSYSPAALVDLAGGTKHTLSATWRVTYGTATRLPLRSSLHAVVLSPGARRASTSAIQEIGTGATSFNPTPFTMTLSSPRPGKALVVASLSSVVTAASGVVGEAAIFVGGVPRLTAPLQTVLKQHPATMVTVVDVPAGDSAIDVRVRRIPSSPSGVAIVRPAPVMNLSAVVLE